MAAFSGRALAPYLILFAALALQALFNSAQ